MKYCSSIVNDEWRVKVERAPRKCGGYEEEEGCVCCGCWIFNLEEPAERIQILNRFDGAEIKEDGWMKSARARKERTKVSSILHW